MRSRLTVVEKIYFQHEDEQPFGVDVKFGRNMQPEESDDQVYFRKNKVGLDWTVVDHGWVCPKKVGCLLIQNNEGNFSRLPKVPTLEQMENDRRRIIELGIIVNGEVQVISVIPPQESCRLVPIDVSNLYVRCQHEQAKFSLYVFPGGEVSGYREDLQSFGNNQSSDRTDS